MKKYMTNLDHQQIVSSETINKKYFYKNNIEKFEKKEITNNPEIDQIKQQWKAFLETKNLNPETYNQQCVEKLIKKKENSFLKKAKNKKELKLLIEARKIVLKSYEKAREENPDFDPEDEILDFYTLDVFEKLKPEITKNEYLKSEDIHKGNYYSRDVYSMITKTDPWYLACHEYYRMNINDNADERSNVDEIKNTVSGYRLEDMIETRVRKFRP